MISTSYLLFRVTNHISNYHGPSQPSTYVSLIHGHLTTSGRNAIPQDSGVYVSRVVINVFSVVWVGVESVSEEAVG